MVAIRFALVGTRNAPVYRIVASEKRKSRDGKFLELLGTINRRLDQPIIKLEKERIQHWMSKGAKPTEAVHKLLAKEGMVPPLELPPTTKRHLPKKKAQKRAEAAGA